MQCAQPRHLSEEGAMETETTGWKWVLQSVVESVVLLLALSLLGPLTLRLIG